jgi:hypothetical protein
MSTSCAVGGGGLSADVMIGEPMSGSPVDARRGGYVVGATT